jgi:hypothetical protein
MKGNLKISISFVLIFFSLTGFIIITQILNPFDFRNHLIWSYKTDNDVYSVAISSDGSYIIAGTYTSLYFFSNSKPKPLWSYEIGVAPYGIDLVISQDGSYAASTFFKTLYMFSNTNSIPLWNFTAHSPFTSLDMSLDGSYIAATVASTLYLFSKSSNVPLWRFSSGNPFSASAISSDGSYVAAVDSKNLYFFSKSSNQSLWNYPMNPDGPPLVKHIAMSPDARYIGLIHRQFDGTHTDSFLYIFETTNPTPIWSKKFNDEHLFSIAISYNGSYIAVTGAGYGNTLYFFSKFNSKPLWTFPLKWELSKLSMSYYGSYLALASAQPSVFIGFSETPGKGVVYLFHKDSPNPKWFYNINAYIPTIAISSNGRYIIIGDSDDNVCFFQR